MLTEACNYIVQWYKNWTYKGNGFITSNGLLCWYAGMTFYVTGGLFIAKKPAHAALFSQENITVYQTEYDVLPSIGPKPVR